MTSVDEHFRVSDDTKRFNTSRLALRTQRVQGFRHGVLNTFIEENDELIGFGALIICKVPTKGEVGRIEDVVIAQNHQGKGLGKLLMNKLVEIAKERKVSKIFLTSNPARTAAQKLYESVGFTKGITDSFFMTL